MGSIQLRFPLSEVVVLAEHAMAASEHAAFAFHSDETLVPALLLVADDGIYLMSNGRPRLLADPATSDGPSHIVRAHVPDGDPRSTPDNGPIDHCFVERVSLTKQFTAADRTIDIIRRYAPDEGWLVLTVTPKLFGVSIVPPNRL